MSKEVDDVQQDQQVMKDLEASIESGEIDLSNPAGVDAAVARLENPGAAPRGADDAGGGEDDGAGDAAQAAAAGAGKGDGTGGSTAQDDTAGSSAAAGDPKNSVVKSKDGKHEIPYTVLEETRTRAATAEAKATELETKLNGLLTQLKTAKETRGGQGQQADQPNATAGDGSVDDALKDILAHEADYPPAMVKLAKAVHGQLTETRSELQVLKTRAVKADTAVQQTEQEALQADIDAVPDIATWQAENGEAWATAVRTDQYLRTLPKWQDKPQRERFAEVARRVREDLGLPPAVNKAAGDKGKGNGAAAASGKGKAAGDDGKGAAPGVRTMSDIPGGQAPVQSGLENVESMSTAQLGDMVENLSDDQLGAFLAKYG